MAFRVFFFPSNSTEMLVLIILLWILLPHRSFLFSMLGFVKCKPVACSHIIFALTWHRVAGRTSFIYTPTQEWWNGEGQSWRGLHVLCSVYTSSTTLPHPSSSLISSVYFLSLSLSKKKIKSKNKNWQCCHTREAMFSPNVWLYY